MNTRARNPALAGFGVGLVLYLLVNGPDAPGHQLTHPTPLETGGSPTTPGAATPTAVPLPPAFPTKELHTHAVEVSWLNGFPPDAAPGDVFDVWVAWNQAVVKEPNVQLLLEDVTLEKIAPPVTPEGPYVAYLIVTRAEARDLLYGTKYGALSVTQPAGGI